MRQAQRGIALGLDVAGAGHAGGDLAAAFRRRRQDEVGGGDSRHLDMQVDAVEQRTGQAALIFGGAARIRPAFAGKAGIAGTAAAAGVHGGDQHEARRIGDVMR
jgi:hypothetical protein